MPSSDSDDEQHPPIFEPEDLDRPASSAPSQIDEKSAHASTRDPYAALRYRAYLLFSIGGFFAVLGGQMRGVAVGWEIYERTRDPLALGWMGLAEFIPSLLLTLPAGQLADRVNRRHIMVFSYVLWMLSSLGLAWLSFHNSALWLIYSCLFFGGTAQAMIKPARSAFMTQLVPNEVLSNAVTWNSSRGQIAGMAGPALGGIAVATIGAKWVYLIAAFFALIFVVFLLMIKPRPQAREERGDASPLQSLLAGLHFVFAQKIILATITLDMFAVLFGGATALLPVFARDILTQEVWIFGWYLSPPMILGWLRTAPAVGALVMSLTLAYLPPMRRAGKTMLWAVAGFGAATVVFGLSKNFWLSLAMLFLTGAFDNISVVIRHTLVQVMTPDSMRGRVSAVNSIFIGTSNELGSFESGVAARLFGPVLAVAGGGLATILVVLGISKAWPQVGALGTLEETAKKTA